MAKRLPKNDDLRALPRGRKPDKVEKQSRELIIPFTPLKLKEVAVELALKVREARDTESKKSAINSELNGQIKRHRERAAELADDHERGGQLGDVGTIRWFFYKENLVVEFRPDTMVVLESRELYPDERQTGLGFPGDDPDGLPRGGRLGPYSRFHPTVGRIDTSPWVRDSIRKPMAPSRPVVPNG